jgi:hypothetical protein
MQELRGIGFGCGRLRSGLEHKNSVRLVEKALELGISHFDVAPSYGQGNAEQLLGEVLAGWSQPVTVYTKFGLDSPQPDLYQRWLRPLLRQVAKPLVRKLASSSGKAQQVPAASASPTSFGDFDPTKLAGSVARSLERLRRQRLDGLLLHEPRSSDPGSELVEALNREVASGRVSKLGVGTGGALKSLPAFGTIRQGAVPQAAPPTSPAAETWVHGLFRMQSSSRFTEVNPTAAKLLGYDYSKPGVLDAPQLLSLYAAALISLGRVTGFIYSATDLAHLEQFAASFRRSSDAFRQATPADREAYLAAAGIH